MVPGIDTYGCQVSQDIIWPGLYFVMDEVGGTTSDISSSVDGLLA